MEIKRTPDIEMLDSTLLNTTTVPKISRLQRRFMEARLRKIASIGAVTQQVSTMHQRAHAELLESTHRGIEAMKSHDGWVEQMNDEAARTYDVVKANFYQTQMGLLQRLNLETQALLEVVLDDVAARPDGFWYDRSLRDRLTAFVMDDIHLELEDRGLPRLRLTERMRQVVLGDIVDAKVTTFDQSQIAARQAMRAQLRTLADELPPGDGEDGDRSVVADELEEELHGEPRTE